MKLVDYRVMLRLLLDEVWSVFLCDATELEVASLVATIVTVM